jgi:hypothetical protein
VFRHIVLLSFHAATTDADVDEVLDALRALPARIPEIRSYVVGADAGLAEGNATIGVVADFEDRDAYLVYRDHPDHQDVIARLIRPRLAARSAVQHEHP